MYPNVFLDNVNVLLVFSAILLPFKIPNKKIYLPSSPPLSLPRQVMMEKRFNRNLSNEGKKSSTLQKQIFDKRAPQNVAPDLTDFMNDMFFGSTEKKAYNLTGGFLDENEDYDDSIRSNTSSKSNKNSNSSSRLTQEWLDEAKRRVASSPSRSDSSQSRLVGSPRFADSGRARVVPGSLGDRRDPLSRSARRNRGSESISSEILLKTAKHNRNRSEPLDTSPASSVERWFSDILKPHNHNPPIPIPEPNPTVPPRPPSSPRKNRFQAQPQGIPTRFSKRTFQTTSLTDRDPIADAFLLSPPKNLVESAQRRSISSSTCYIQEKRVLSPPRNLVESAQRRSVSSTTCSNDKIVSRALVNVQEKVEGAENKDLNGLLNKQRVKIGKILCGEMNGKAKIVLSGPSNSTSSMVAAICYAWLLENKTKNNNGTEENEATQTVVVPVMNMKREKMLKQRQVAWLFHHVGIDATALLFSDEVDLETLMMSKQLSMLVVGQDILKTNGEVGSQCTILTDNYCEDAYDLLETPILRKLMMAGILLDTQNLNMSGKLPMTRDSEAVQLLSVNSAPSYRNTLYDQLMQEQKDSSFLEALQKNYTKFPTVGSHGDGASMEHKAEEKKFSNEEFTPKPAKISNDVKNVKKHSSPSKSGISKSPPVKAPSPASTQKDDRGKNTFFLAKWFGFGK